MSWIYKIQTGAPWTKSTTNSNVVNNIWAFYSYFNGYMTKAAMAGILGNMMVESYLNPGEKQGESTDLGWGLIQWSPSTELTNYVSGNWYDGNAQCEVIKKEGEGTISGRWLPTSAYAYSWYNFCQITDNQEACKAYLYERERAGVSALAERLQFASEIYNILNTEPVESDDLIIVALKLLKVI